MKQFVFLNSSEMEWHNPFDGVLRQVVAAKNLTVCLYHMKAGLDFPMHDHPQEQMAYIIEGKIEFRVGEGEEETKHLVGGGTFYCFAPGVRHGGHFIEDCIILDVFSPPMDKYDAEAVKPKYAQEG